jgi:hypothetical protein
MIDDELDRTFHARTLTKFVDIAHAGDGYSIALERVAEGIEIEAGRVVNGGGDPGRLRINRDFAPNRKK